MKNITVLTACRNRENNLNLMRKNVLELDNVSEHLIIDWSSDRKITLEKQSKARIIVKENEKNWWLSRAYNFGFNFVETEYILKLDTESVMDSKLFNKLNYKDYDLIIFYKQEYNPGNFLVSKKLLDNVNGFNEYIFGWGWDDHDLINRITKKSNNTKVLKIYGYISETSDLDKDRVEVRHLNSKFNKDRKYFYAIKKSFNSANSYISNLDVWKNQLLNYEDNDIKHFYSIKQLSNYIKLRHKFYFFKSFFMVLFPHRKIYRRIMPFFYSLFSEKRIYKLIGVNIYPYKT